MMIYENDIYMCTINIFERTEKFIPVHIGMNMLQAVK